MNRFSFIPFFLALLSSFLQANAAETIPARLPAALENDEAALLKAARAVQPELLKNGYRKYELISARVAAWTRDKEVEPKDLKIHLILPSKKQKGPYPLLVYVHGGGFMGGNPNLNVHNDRSFSTAFRYVLDHGVAVASVGYRLAREGGWPAPVSDPLCSMRFLQQHGANWDLMTDRLALVGHSAGARAVGLIGMVPQDAFHTQNLPWQQDKPVAIAGTFLWAGGINTKPLLDSFGEFGKPRWYSVARLHHGEHPAWDDGTRHSLRIRNNSPHYSKQMPPLQMVRGRSDYGGDHSDAQQAVALWQKLGIDAALDLVEGGHNTAGPPETLLRFVKTHVVESPFEAPDLDVEKTVRVLLELDDPLSALEVLTAAHTTEGGTLVPAGEWLLAMHDGSMMWLPDSSNWPDAHRALARQAREQAAELETVAANNYFERSDWFRAGEAARNVRKLIGKGHVAETINQIEQREAKEAGFFNSWHHANRLWVAGDFDAAKGMVLKDKTPKILEALDSAEEAKFPLPIPAWADQHGTDLYGPWVSIQLQEGVALRLRWIAPGSWDLPSYLQYQPRGRAKSEPVTQIVVQKGFWIAETETTRAQWKALQRDEAVDPNAETADQARTRKDYLQIINWLKTLSERKENLLARLPTEPEWLHAATGGGRQDIRGGTDVHAVHALNVDPQNPASSSVYSVTPDALGLYGMIGGVLEWTASGNRREARFNDEKGRFRIYRYPMSRGGAWSSFPHVLGVGTREWHRHANRQPDLGFRLVIGGDATAEDWLDDVVKH